MNALRAGRSHLSQALRSAPGAPSRSFSSSIEPVELPFELAEPKQKKSDDTLVIAHGFLGSKQNWRSLTKAFAQDLGMSVYALDLRNHGTAPHRTPHTYPAMATDVAHFFNQHGLTSKSVHLMGHSMGGKVVMTAALDSSLNSSIKSLISADMAPSRGLISKEFTNYVDAMIEVSKNETQSKSEADALLQKVEPNLGTRQFLLTNSILKDRRVRFRIPLELLRDAIDDIGDFPWSPGEARWDGPTLFVKGTRSRYINEKNLPIARSFFPNMELAELDAGHWVHAEQPAAFIKLVGDFVRKAT